MADLEDDISDDEMSHPRVESPISPKQCIEKWNEKLQTGILSSTHFKEYWRVHIPRIYSPPLNGSCLDWSFSEEKAHEILFSPLEEFICNGDPQEILLKLSQLDKPPSVCGRVFKLGEPTYSCRECGMDSTCVLCVDCFKQSAHRNHKYKMGTSGGGGCCDCGDDEAWKTEPYCDIHMIGKQAKLNDENSLPAEIAERTAIVFDAVLWYAYHLLTLEHNPGLPADLQMKDSEKKPFTFLESLDAYCTVLYNDETHTFEQVISTLARVMKCSQRDAIEFVTNIDREGRAVVKCSSFQHCTELKSEIEKFTSRHGNKPVKVMVVHSDVIAHQTFAIKLLGWLPSFLSHGEGFRNIFTKVAIQKKLPETSIVEGVLLRDSQMWKSARAHWHRLLISGMLMEYENKKALATLFTKNYGHVMKDFIRDDHEHSYSVSSLSVQLFTVPTLAHHLIANEEVLFVLLNTFSSECSRKLNKDGKLEFERNAPNNTFKRAQFILYDLKYLLSAKPNEWTDGLRRGFFQGLTLILNLLIMMQGMDAVSRQVGQHMEYEPEWESAFNLHIKLASVISLVLEWCGTDVKVLTKTYQATLKKLQETPSYDPGLQGEVRELADHSAACLHYDVSTQPVSIHLPLSRFLAGLHLYLETYHLNFDTAFQVTKPTPEQIMEPVLRTQAMISQVHAGMWRRNGYALLNQLYFYHNVKCRSEMLDRDIVLLQVCASLIESNEFLIHVLNKFNLINWANSDFESKSLKNPEEDSMRQTINLVEEFLGLMITLIGERYIPGIAKVSTEDRIRKEIIQQLCIKPLPHSEINKTIPDDILNETVLDSVIEQIATFKKPSQTSGKGVYELKPEYYKQYNVFFYHYTREELSKSEEAQRKRRKTAGELECCPPPDLPELTLSFNMVANLLQCDVMLHIMHTVLERCANLRARSFSEPQLHKVLHLIGYALQEQQSHRYPFLVFTERANKWNLRTLLEELSTSARVESHKDLIIWTLNKYREVSSPQQKHELSEPMQSSSSEVTTDPSKDEKVWRAKMAAERRAKLMAQMAAMQNSFMKENAKLFEESNSDVKYKKQELSDSSMDVSEGFAEAIVLGKEQTPKTNVERRFTCILCQEEQVVSSTGPALVSAAFVQQSTVLCQKRNWQNGYENITDHLFLSANLGPAPHTSTCGHVMHSQCWQKYFDNVITKEHRRPYRLRHPSSFDIEKQEFLCPLCECLSNTVLPIIPPLGTLQSDPPSTDIDFSEWLNSLRASLRLKRKICQGIYKCMESLEEIHRQTHEAGEGPSTEPDTPPEGNSAVAKCTGRHKTPPPEGCDPYCNSQTHQVYYPCSIEQIINEMNDAGKAFIALFPTTTPTLSENLIEMIQLYAQTTYTKGLGVNPHSGDARVPLMAWKSCAYTVHTMEFLLRDLNKPLLGDLSSRQRDCLENLVRTCATIASIWKKPNVIGSHALKLLAMILDCPAQIPSILDWDCFGVLVPLVLALPSLFAREFASIATGTVQDLYVLKLLFVAHIAKILITTDFQESMMDIDTEEFVSDTEYLPLIEILKFLNKNEGVNAHHVCEIIKESSIPFLRCCVLFFHFLTDIPASTSLTEVKGDTYENLCSYLGITETLPELCNILTSHNLLENWCKHPDVEKYLQGNLGREIIRQPPKINRLVILPEDYSELINTVSLFTCPNSDREDSRNPTMCLVCGEMLCSQSYCCQMELNKLTVGACTFHAHNCGAGVGIFLRVRECEILFLASPNRGCSLSPPYLDDYGETDQGLRRGNPLHLCEERYKKLHTLWLSHSLYEEIARTLESSSTLISTQWQHL